MLENIKYLVIDVDGTMTDGGIYYDEHGNESKKFCTKDGAGFFAARESGIQIIVLTGFVGCPADSCEEVIQLADYVSSKKGGYGAVRDVVEALLKDRGQWDEIVNEIYGCGI